MKMMTIYGWWDAWASVNLLNILTICLSRRYCVLNYLMAWQIWWCRFIDRSKVHLKFLWPKFLWEMCLYTEWMKTSPEMFIFAQTIEQEEAWKERSQRLIEINWKKIEKNNKREFLTSLSSHCMPLYDLLSSVDSFFAFS